MSDIEVTDVSYKESYCSICEQKGLLELLFVFEGFYPEIRRRVVLCKNHTELLNRRLEKVNNVLSELT